MPLLKKYVGDIVSHVVHNDVNVIWHTNYIHEPTHSSFIPLKFLWILEAHWMDGSNVFF